MAKKMSSIYVPKGKALEYCNLALNIYTGCNHGCRYCFSRAMFKRFSPHEKFEEVKQREGLVAATIIALERFKGQGRRIHLCFSCDPYPAAIDTTATREVIKAIKDSGNHVQILTKGSSRAVRDIDLLDENDWFGVTITGDSGVLESGTDSPSVRIEMLRMARERGIKTWVSCEPVLIADAIYELIQAEGEFIDLLWVGKLNHYTLESLGLPAIDWKAFALHCMELCNKKGVAFKIKKDLRLEIEKTNEVKSNE